MGGTTAPMRMAAVPPLGSLETLAISMAGTPSTRAMATRVGSLLLTPLLAVACSHSVVHVVTVFIEAMDAARITKPYADFRCCCECLLHGCLILGFCVEEWTAQLPNYDLLPLSTGWLP